MEQTTNNIDGAAILSLISKQTEHPLKEERDKAQAELSSIDQNTLYQNLVLLLKRNDIDEKDLMKTAIYMKASLLNGNLLNEQK